MRYANTHKRPDAVSKSDCSRLASRMMRKYHVRFRGGALEKGLRATSPVTLPGFPDTSDIAEREVRDYELLTTFVDGTVL